MLIGKWYSLDEEKILRNNELVAAQRVNAFKEKNIPLSQKVYSLPGADFSDISNKYDINKPAVLLCEKCIIIFTMTEKIIT